MLAGLCHSIPPSLNACPIQSGAYENAGDKQSQCNNRYSVTPPKFESYG
jgi:hypothetical protein